MVEAPTPSPPINRNAAKETGSFTSAEPIAETKYNAPIKNKVFLRPNLLVGIPPNIAPTTVPHKAIAITTEPWKASVVPHSSCNCLSAPDITTVSNPKRNPARAAQIDQSVNLFIAHL